MRSRKKKKRKSKKRWRKDEVDTKREKGDGETLKRPRKKGDEA